MRTIRSRAHAARPLRVHAHCNESDPRSLVADLRELIAAGAQVTLSARSESPPLVGLGPWRLDVDDAVADARPDLVLFASSVDARVELPLIEARELPFAIRTADASNTLSDHTLSLGTIEVLERELEPALREALTRWLYEQAGARTQP
jgi:hypothetical protein